MCAELRTRSHLEITRSLIIYGAWLTSILNRLVSSAVWVECPKSVYKLISGMHRTSTFGIIPRLHGRRIFSGYVKYFSNGWIVSTALQGPNQGGVKGFTNMQQNKGAGTQLAKIASMPVRSSFVFQIYSDWPVRRLFGHSPSIRLSTLTLLIMSRMTCSRPPHPTFFPLPPMKSWFGRRHTTWPQCPTGIRTETLYISHRTFNWQDTHGKLIMIKIDCGLILK